MVRTTIRPKPPRTPNFAVLVGYARLSKPTGSEVVGEKVRSGAESAREGMARLGGATSAALVGESKGRRVRQAVHDRNGYLLAAPGQIVTDHVIARAEAEDKAQALLASVGLTSGGAAVSGARNAASSAGSELKEGMGNLKDGAANLWEKVKGKVGDAKERGAEELEERRINAALGRPVTRVILDRQDGVILNFGEIITHGAIERARHEEVLEALLDSVYKAEAEFSQDKLRAPEAGSESLEPETAAKTADAPGASQNRR